MRCMISVSVGGRGILGSDGREVWDAEVAVFSLDLSSMDWACQTT